MNKTKKINCTNKRSPFMIPILVILGAYVLSVVLILVWGFITSLKCVTDFSDFGNVLGLPNMQYEDSWYTVAFGNYIDVFNSFGYRAHSSTYITLWGVHEGEQFDLTFGDFLFNSLIFGIGGVVIHVFTLMTVSYVCAKYRYKFSAFLYAMVFVLMTIPLAGTDAAAIVLWKRLGLFDSYLGMVIGNINFLGMYFLIFYAHFEVLPDSYFEAAELDGASQLQCYLSIAVPLSMKMFSTIFLIQFMESWNSYQGQVIYYPTHPTLAYGIYRMTQNTQGAEVGSKFSGIPVRVAGCMILAIPMLILFSIFSGKLLGSLTMGGLKG